MNSIIRISSEQKPSAKPPEHELYFIGLLACLIDRVRVKYLPWFRSSSPSTSNSYSFKDIRRVCEALGTVKFFQKPKRVEVL